MSGRKPQGGESASRGAGNEPKRECAISGRRANTPDGLRSKERRVRRLWDEHHGRRLAEQSQHFDIDRLELVA